jgi:DNA-binding response OmpR family regulator
MTALSVGANGQDQLKLAAIFQAKGWKLGQAQTLEEARAILKSIRVPVVIAESDLPEGGWREILEDLRQAADPPELVVTSRLADESLWAEVLNMGGYDVLVKPLDDEEVVRVIGAAARQFVDARRPPRKSGKRRVAAAGAQAAAAEVA